MSFPNRIFMHAAQTDRLTNTLDISTLPTIWDRLAKQGVSARYYAADVPFLALWGTKYLPITRTYDDFLADWRAVKHRTMRMDRADIERGALGHLRLVP